MVNIPNITEPITKLIEVIAAGCGHLYEPLKLKKLADAKAYEIKTIAAAISESQGIQTKTEYKDQDVVVTRVENVADEDAINKAIGERALTRLAYQEAKKQINIEHISQRAAEDLRGEQSVSSEPVDADWISRFFDTAEHITSEEMQQLWGKVLAGEVKRPGSYSLRTLDLLKNISRQDAEVFTRAAQLAFKPVGNTPMMLSDPHASKYGLEFDDILLLRELGLVTQGLQFHLYRLPESSITYLIYHNKAIVIEKDADSPVQQVPVLVFTRIGQELLPLIDTEANLSYAYTIGSLFKSASTAVKIGAFAGQLDGSTYAVNLREI